MEGCAGAESGALVGGAVLWLRMRGGGIGGL